MSDNNNQLTRGRLKYIIRHASHDQDEDPATVNSKVESMMTEMDPHNTGHVTCEEFIKFLHSIPEDQLSRVLSFKIIKDGGHSEHSSQASQPI